MCTHFVVRWVFLKSLQGYIGFELPAIARVQLQLGEDKYLANLVGDATVPIAAR